MSSYTDSCHHATCHSCIEWLEWNFDLAGIEAEVGSNFVVVGDVVEVVALAGWIDYDESDADNFDNDHFEIVAHCEIVAAAY